MHSLDDYAYCNRLRNVNPKLKVLFALATLGVAVFSPSPITPLLILLIMVSLTLFAAGIPAGVYFRWLSGPLVFTMPVSIAMVFFFGSAEPWFSFKVSGYVLTAYKDGFNLGFLVVSRVLGGAACLFFLAFTTPMIELFSSLRLLRVPDILVELSMMIYRYIFVVLGEATRMRHAQRMRLGYAGFRRALSSFSLLAGSLFIRAWDRGERLYVSMSSRCYNGRLELLQEDKPLPKKPFIALLALESVFILTSYLTRGFKAL
jgi:cobalt/nickel transport system permease protein